MRIGFLLDGFTGGGTGRVTSIIGNALRRSGQCEVYALGYTQNHQEDLYTTDFPVQYFYPDKISMRSAILKKGYLKIVREFVEANSIDLLVACGVQFYPIATGIAARCGIKSVCWEHTNPNRTTDFCFQSLSRSIGAKTSTCNVVLTQDALSTYERKFPGNFNVQIYNPVDPAIMSIGTGYDGSSKKIISVGRLCEQKRFDRLIRIAAQVLERHADWTWDIYGEGPLKADLQALISEHHLEDRLFLRGQASDLYHRYRQYAFMVMTSAWEGFPMTLLEGAASALPLIAFDVPTGPREIITDDRNGYICRDGDEDGMIKRIEAMIEAPGMRMAMSDRSREVAERFDIDRICAQWLDLIAKIVGESGGAHP